MVPKCDDIWPFDDRRLAIQTTVFSAWIFTFAPGSKYSGLIGTMSVFNCLYFGHYFSNGADICLYKLFPAAFSELKAEITIF